MTDDPQRALTLDGVAFPRTHLNRMVKARGNLGELRRMAAHARVLPVASGGVFPVDPTPDGDRLSGLPLTTFDPLRHILVGEIEGGSDVVWFAEVADEVDQPIDQLMDRHGSLRESHLSPDERDVAQAAVALVNWHRSAPVCDRCHQPTVPAPGGGSRVCERGHETYPRTDPAVIMALVDPDDRLLLAHQRTWAPGRCSVLAGFVEAGESAESAVAREVDEEVGLAVGALRWLGSQSWPFPRSLMLAFEASASGDPRPDGDEIGWAHWFSREDVRDAEADGSVTLPPPTSIAGRMIHSWRQTDR